MGEKRKVFSGFLNEWIEEHGARLTDLGLVNDSPDVQEWFQPSLFELQGGTPCKRCLPCVEEMNAMINNAWREIYDATNRGMDLYVSRNMGNKWYVSLGFLSPYGPRLTRCPLPDSLVGEGVNSMYFDTTMSVSEVRTKLRALVDFAKETWSNRKESTNNLDTAYEFDWKYKGK